MKSFLPHSVSLVRYIYKLCDMHLKFGHFSEAAFTLLLHAKKLEVRNELYVALLTLSTPASLVVRGSSHLPTTRKVSVSDDGGRTQRDALPRHNRLFGQGKGKRLRGTRTFLSHFLSVAVGTQHCSKQRSRRALRNGF